MDAVNRQAQIEMDQEILSFVRGFEQHAPVTLDSVFTFITIQRRRRVTKSCIVDRLRYLVDAGQLKKIVEWEGGEVERFECTALGRDILDGNVPPPTWRKS